jgi:hypothetical protein
VAKLYSASAPIFLANSDSGMAWLEAHDPPRVLFASPGSAQRELAVLSSAAYGTFAAADRDAVYWTSSTAVMKAPIDGSAVSRIASGLRALGDIALGQGWAYVADAGQGRILRVALDGSGNRPSGPITGPCPAPLGTREERQQTPRTDQNLERLALALDPGSLTASQSTYDRVEADVAAIERLNPELAGSNFPARDDGKRLALWLDDIGALSLEAAEYTAWDCLNDAYGLASISPATEEYYGPRVTIELDGIFDLHLVAEQYRRLPGVAIAEPAAPSADDAGAELCASRSGERYEYVIDRTSGQCPERCEHEAHRFASDAAGQISALGVWDSRTSEPTPEWFRSRCPLPRD